MLLDKVLSTIHTNSALNTIERLDMTIRTYTGGYIRYENDSNYGDVYKREMLIQKLKEN